MPYLAVAEFSMTWLDLAKGGIGLVFLGLFIWLIVYQIPSMHNDLMAAEQRFGESIESLLTSYRAEQETARDAFRREQEAGRKANAAHMECVSTAFESALREICSRAERTDERMMALVRDVTARLDNGTKATHV